MKSESREQKGLPGGVVLPGGLCLACMVAFAYLFTHPGLVDLGLYMSAPGMLILLSAATFTWFLVAVGKRPPRD